jgi:co-chaperonin GroES (HSP10)
MALEKIITALGDRGDDKVDDLDLKVYGDRVVVVLDEMAEFTVYKDPSTGRVFKMTNADEHSERTRFATVMAVGDNPETQSRFKVGDRIIMSWHGGTRLHFLDKTVYGRMWSEDLLRIVRDEEILASFTVKE